jgi:putative transposase
MVRPLRIEYPGAVYHVTSRGDRREPIAHEDADRALFLSTLGQALERFDAQAWAYCLMGNHYHLVLHTRQANLSRLMRQINGVYTQAFNRSHGVTGHLFQGRFKAILVDSDSYLLEVCRYVDLNPVRAGMVKRPHDYRWSSYRALAGLADQPGWLDSKPVYGQIAPGKPKALAAAKYAEFVSQGRGVKLWDEHLNQQIYLGGDDFIARMQEHAGLEAGASAPLAVARRNVSKFHLSTPARGGDVRTYAGRKWASRKERNQNICDAFHQGGHSQTAIAVAFDVSTSTVSRVVAEFGKGG